MTDALGRATFAAPGGVLPGEIGRVVDEHVGAVDVVATILDLAVRNYLRIEEPVAGMPAADWRLVRLNPPDEALRPYERAVYDLLLGAAGEVRVAELRGLDANGLARVRSALYADVVDKRWSRRRPDAERDLFWWIGEGIALGGGALTVVLALTGPLALIGVALTFGARLVPARTERGGTSVGQLRGLREYLRSVPVQRSPRATASWCSPVRCPARWCWGRPSADSPSSPNSIPLRTGRRGCTGTASRCRAGPRSRTCGASANASPACWRGCTACSPDRGSCGRGRRGSAPAARAGGDLPGPGR